MRPNKLSLTQPFRLVGCLPGPITLQRLADRYLGQANILHHGPDDGQAARFGREDINLIRALAYFAKQAFNSIGTPNIAVHHWREGIERQEMLFILAEAAHGFGIVLLILGFESGQVQERVFFLLLLPDARQVGDDLLVLAFGNRIQDVALLVDQAALAQRGRKQGRDRRQESIMSIGDQQIDLSHSTRAQVLQQATPAVFVFFRTGAQGQHFSAALQIHAERGENHGRIRLAPMPHREVDPIQVDDAVVGEQAALSPGFILLGQGLVQTADRTGAGVTPSSFSATLPTRWVLVPLTNMSVRASTTSGS